jgi:hypothetical protein
MNPEFLDLFESLDSQNNSELTSKNGLWDGTTSSLRTK